MKNHRMLIICIVISLLSFTIACEFSASTANIKEAYTAQLDNGDLQQTAEFTQSDIFYCIVEVANAPDDTLTKAMWYAEDAAGIEPNTFLSEADLQGGGEMTFSLTNEGMLWPAGKYKIELYLNGEFDRQLEFNIIGSMGAVKLLDAYMFRDENGSQQPTDIFRPDEVFYVNVLLQNPQPDTSVKVIWIAADVPGAEPNYNIGESEFILTPLLENDIALHISFTELWPTGVYRAELLINEESQGSLVFSVVE